MKKLYVLTAFCALAALAPQAQGNDGFNTEVRRAHGTASRIVDAAKVVGRAAQNPQRVQRNVRNAASTATRETTRVVRKVVSPITNAVKALTR